MKTAVMYLKVHACLRVGESDEDLFCIPLTAKSVHTGFVKQICAWRLRLLLG